MSYTAQDLEFRAEALLDNDNYEEAELLFKQALQLKEQEHGIDSPEAAQDIYNLGLLCFAQEKYVEAEIYLYKALSLEIAHFGMEHTYVTETMAMLTELVKNCNELIIAQPPLHQARQQLRPIAFAF